MRHQANALHSLLHSDMSGPAAPSAFATSCIQFASQTHFPPDPQNWLIILSSPMAPPDICTLIGINLKTAWSRHFLPSSASSLASPDFFDAKKFGFVPAQLWQGGADVCDALRVGFSVEDLKGGGWSARSVAEAVGGEFSPPNGISLNP